MALKTTGSPDFKKMVKSRVEGDVVQTSEDTSTMANKATFDAGIKTVAVAATAEKLPTKAVPAGYTVVVKALNSNTTPIHVAETQAQAQIDASAFELQPDEFVTLKVSNLDKIWIDANTNGEGVTHIVEVD